MEREGVATDTNDLVDASAVEGHGFRFYIILARIPPPAGRLLYHDSQRPLTA